MRPRLTRHTRQAFLAIVLIMGALLVFAPAFAQTTSFGVVVVNTPFLNIRNGPGAQFAVIGVANGGDELAVTGISRDRGWWRVQTPFGEGFVFAEYVLFRGEGSLVPFVDIPATATSAAPTAIVLPAALNVRSGPSLNYPSLGSVPQKFVLPVVGQFIQTGWYRVNSPFGPGWVANDEVSLQGDTSIIPRVDETGAGSLPGTTVVQPSVSVPTTTAAPGLTTTTGTSFVPTNFQLPGTVDYQTTNVRTLPRFDAPSLGVLGKGNAVTIMGRDQDGVFLLINSPFGPGWVPTAGVRFPSEIFFIPVVDLNPQLSTGNRPNVPNGTDIRTGGGPFGVSQHEELRVRIRPSLDAAVIGTLGAGVQATVLGRDFDIQFFEVNTPFGVGWVRTSGFRLDPTVDVFKHVGVTAVNGIPVRGQTTPITTTTTTTTPVVVPNTSFTGLVGAVVVVNTSSMNLRSGPGPQYSVLQVVNGGDEFTVVGQLSDATWYKVSTPFGQGWLFHEFVLFRGEPSTIPVVSS